MIGQRREGYGHRIGCVGDSSIFKLSPHTSLLVYCLNPEASCIIYYPVYIPMLMMCWSNRQVKMFNAICNKESALSNSIISNS